MEKKPRILIDSDQIAKRVKELGKEITEDYRRGTCRYFIA